MESRFVTASDVIIGRSEGCGNYIAGYCLGRITSRSSALRAFGVRACRRIVTTGVPLAT